MWAAGLFAFGINWLIREAPDHAANSQSLRHCKKDSLLLLTKPALGIKRRHAAHAGSRYRPDGKSCLRNHRRQKYRKPTCACPPLFGKDIPLVIEINDAGKGGCCRIMANGNKHAMHGNFQLRLANG